MEDPLKQLPEILNQGRLKSVTFKEEQRQSVLRKARELNRPPAPKSWFYHWFHQSLSLALAVAFIFIFIQYFQDIPEKSKSEVKQAEEQQFKLPYANQAILTKVRHDMRHQYNVTGIDSRQTGDTLSVYIIFPNDMSPEKQFSLTESYLKEVSHLTLNEPYGAQTYLGELWKYVNLKVYTTSSDSQVIAARLNIEFNYDWFGEIDSKNGKLTWKKISNEENPYLNGITN